MDNLPNVAGDPNSDGPSLDRGNSPSNVPISTARKHRRDDAVGDGSAWFERQKRARNSDMTSTRSTSRADSHDHDVNRSAVPFIPELGFPPRRDSNPANITPLSNIARQIHVQRSVPEPVVVDRSTSAADDGHMDDGYLADDEDQDDEDQDEVELLSHPAPIDYFPVKDAALLFVRNNLYPIEPPPGYLATETPAQRRKRKVCEQKASVLVYEQFMRWYRQQTSLPPPVLTYKARVEMSYQMWVTAHRATRDRWQARLQKCEPGAYSYTSTSSE